MRRVCLFLSVVLCILAPALPAFPRAEEGYGTRIAVMRFTGPRHTSLDVDEYWKLKNKSGKPDAYQLSIVNDALQAELTRQLSERLGTTVVTMSELRAAQESIPPSVHKSKTSPALAQRLNAKYFVVGSIDRLAFDGNTISPDEYKMVVSTRLINPLSGKTVWKLKSREFKSKTYTKKSGMDVAHVFADIKVPEISARISSKIASALGR